MTENLPPEDQPPAEWRRFVSDEQSGSTLPEPSLLDPVSVAHLFFNAVQDHEEYQVALLNLTTPESHAAWGDFSEAAAFLASIDDLGFTSMVNQAVGDPDVVYASILSGVTQGYEVLDAQPVKAAAVLTLVRRPDHDGRWLVHQMGPFLLPEEVPHGD